ncbi:hypothetical protein [Lacticaseibacillus zhaodongensis]|uniref:hypothetical protein n=1 Tax=Lacticaseibacillus zhaodongensis TaxID=2668065 RepID=UPI0012D3251D|nr:hypothetical protein [Lacticaseibacillus zhaodongensis]
MVELNPQVQELLDQANQGFDTPINIKVDEDTKSGVLRNDNGDTEVTRDGVGTITISDSTNVDYTLSHELWHLLLQEMNYPTTGTAVHTANKSFDDQMRAIAGALESAVIHSLVISWQMDNNIVTPEVLTQVRKGIEEDTPVETDVKDDGEVLTRIFNLLDGLVLLGGPESDLVSAWYTKYPVALDIATKLFQVIQDTDIQDARGYRAAIVKLFNKFNEVMVAFDIALDFAGFIVVTPVLSTRQLRLSLNQIYQLQDIGYTSNKPHTIAYDAKGIQDGQTAFVLQLAKNQTSPEFFQKLYARPLRDVLDEYEIGFYERKPETK